MSLEQVVFALAGAVCVAGAVLAVTHRDARASGAALMATLLALAVLYAGLAAPAVAALVILVALFATVPLVVHLTVPAARGQAAEGPVVSGAAALIGAATLGILWAAIALGEVPVNVSMRSSDGYDFASLADLVAGRAAAAVGAVVLVLLAGAASARAARRDRHVSS